MKKCQDCQHCRVFWNGAEGTIYKCELHHKTLLRYGQEPKEVKIPEWCERDSK